MIPVEIYCCLCAAKVKTEIPTPAGWTCGEYGHDIEDALCPQHAIIEDFKSSQCVGCVGDWGECPLWESFAYSKCRNILVQDLEQIRRGVCPRRVNGTFGFDLHARKFEELNLSEHAPSPAGQALADAIEAYCRTWP